MNVSSMLQIACKTYFILYILPRLILSGTFRCFNCLHCCSCEGQHEDMAPRKEISNVVVELEIHHG